METDIKHVVDSFSRQISELSVKLAIAEATVTSLLSQNKDQVSDDGGGDK
jgi:hypothetical protein